MSALEVDYELLREWLRDNCGLCLSVGDPLWINVQCPFLWRVVWGDDPHGPEDAAIIMDRVLAGPCPSFRLDEYKRQRRRRAIERYGVRVEQAE